MHCRVHTCTLVIIKQSISFDTVSFEKLYDLTDVLGWDREEIRTKTLAGKRGEIRTKTLAGKPVQW